MSTLQSSGPWAEGKGPPPLPSPPLPLPPPSPPPLLFFLHTAKPRSSGPPPSSLLCSSTSWPALLCRTPPVHWSLSLPAPDRACGVCGSGFIEVTIKSCDCYFKPPTPPNQRCPLRNRLGFREDVQILTKLPLNLVGPCPHCPSDAVPSLPPWTGVLWEESLPLSRRSQLWGRKPGLPAESDSFPVGTEALCEGPSAWDGTGWPDLPPCLCFGWWLWSPLRKEDAVRWDSPGTAPRKPLLSFLQLPPRKLPPSVCPPSAGLLSFSSRRRTQPAFPHSVQCWGSAQGLPLIPSLLSQNPVRPFQFGD
ncbi:wiskott-Aldrich syndrome protein family member 1-like [Marmota marmota marmota]|uniref:wiskott-Aldrich syndrome protein family member 1-like n=1 Tax=Marmota marmota marmota TaxID=9994 RepID=UPI002093CC35|nr:wiskott-Aldrich syndrome protein family member 1-like [Marmota marmota marmota]XP_048663317.1 wiskott-Aldrich syndrome protein family member 1-like [Marmota marmota marmota]XP_048663318.1 wiskott-Aldrich syndrome protein family member 1-like [Marmota marmota marmota]